jgi:acetamidase/formamidase
MKSIGHESLKYTIDFRHPPVLEVEQGEQFTLETEDAPSGTYRTSDDAARLLDVWYLRHFPPMANPVTGPVYIKGVEPGDTLVVHIDRLDLDAQGATYWRPGGKPLGDSLKWHDLSKPTLVIGRIENGEVLMDEADIDSHVETSPPHYPDADRRAGYWRHERRGSRRSQPQSPGDLRNRAREYRNSHNA